MRQSRLDRQPLSRHSKPRDRGLGIRAGELIELRDGVAQISSSERYLGGAYRGFRLALRRTFDPADRHQGTQPGKRLGLPISLRWKRRRVGDAPGDLGQTLDQGKTPCYPVARDFGERRGHREKVGSVMGECREGAELRRKGSCLLDRLAHLQQRHQQCGIGRLSPFLRSRPPLLRCKSVGKIGSERAEPRQLLLNFSYLGGFPRLARSRLRFDRAKLLLEPLQPRLERSNGGFALPISVARGF